jgi:hypothetical protein
MRPRRRLAAFLTGATIALALPAASVLAATPVTNGCPASAQLVSVAWLETQGPYQLPARLDNPANGGNGDGYVCAFPLPEAVSDVNGVSFTIYQFFEDNLPAQGQP